jgi:hypothetical protein
MATHQIDPQISDPAPGPASPRRQPRITPRNSNGNESLSSTKETPWRTLNQLANMQKPTTPLRRASSAGPPSTHQSSRGIPASQARTPAAGNKLNGSVRRPIAVTPHGRAAQRELDLRRAGFTPGKDRRRSGRQQRETPRDILRQLSRHLAPRSYPTVPTPQAVDSSTLRARRIADDGDMDDGSDIERPRLSLPLGDDEDDDDDSLLLPPQSAGLEDENFTIQSVELPRRATSELPLGRLSRGSFGSIRMSDVFADINQLGRGGQLDESSFLVAGDFGGDFGGIEDDDVLLG